MHPRDTHLPGAVLCLDLREASALQQLAVSLGGVQVIAALLDVGCKAVAGLPWPLAVVADQQLAAGLEPPEESAMHAKLSIGWSNNCPATGLANKLVGLLRREQATDQRLCMAAEEDLRSRANPLSERNVALQAASCQINQCTWQMHQ